MTNIYLAGHGTNIKINKDQHGWYADVTLDNGKKAYRIPYHYDECAVLSVARGFVQAKLAGCSFDLFLGSDGHYTDETQRKFYICDGKVIEFQWANYTDVKDVPALIEDLEETNTRMYPKAYALKAEHGSNIDLLRCQATDRLLINLRAMIDAGMIQEVLAPVA